MAGHRTLSRRSAAPLRFRGSAALVASGLTLAFAAPARAAPPGPPVEEHRLANGLRVRLAPDDALDDVTVAVGYGAGSADDPQGLEGLAQVVGHLMFQGSRHVPAGEHGRALESAGAWNINGTTGVDATIFHETLPPGEIALALWLESDRMGFAAESLTPEALEKVAKIIAYARRDRIVDAPLAWLGVLLHERVFPAWHPYYLNEDADVDDSSVEAIKPRDVRAFLRTWYVPENATLAIAGRFEPRATLNAGDEILRDAAFRFSAGAAGPPGLAAR